MVFFVFGHLRSERPSRLQTVKLTDRLLSRTGNARFRFAFYARRKRWWVLMATLINGRRFITDKRRLCASARVWCEHESRNVWKFFTISAWLKRERICPAPFRKQWSSVFTRCRRHAVNSEVSVWIRSGFLVMLFAFVCFWCSLKRSHVAMIWPGDATSCAFKPVLKFSWIVDIYHPAKQTHQCRIKLSRRHEVPCVFNEQHHNRRENKWNLRDEVAKTALLATNRQFVFRVVACRVY